MSCGVDFLPYGKSFEAGNGRIVAVNTVFIYNNEAGFTVALRPERSVPTLSAPAVLSDRKKR